MEKGTGSIAVICTMEAVDLHAEAWEGIRKGYEAERLAHAFVIVGAPRGNAMRFAEAVLKLLFCERTDRPCNECVACRQVEAHRHADTLWIEPQSKSRQILADDVRILIKRIGQTAFEGGWKTGVVLSADRMNNNSENALLKTLEEPPPKSMLLLITDSPETLLPTILSRCQKITLSSGQQGLADTEWRLPLMEILHDLPPSSGLSAARLASRLKALFDQIKAGIADAVEEEMGQGNEAYDESKLKDILAARTNARLKEIQADVFREMVDWQRDVLMLTNGIEDRHLRFSREREVLAKQATCHSQSSALKAIGVIEGMPQRVTRNIPDLQIFDEAFRRLVQ